MPKSRRTCESESPGRPEQNRSFQKTERRNWAHAFLKREAEEGCVEYLKIKVNLNTANDSKSQKICLMMVPEEKNERNKAQEPNQNKLFRVKPEIKRKTKKLHTIKNKQEK